MDKRTLTLIDNKAADGAAEGKCHRWLNAAHLVGNPNPPLIQAWAESPQEAVQTMNEITRRYNTYAALVAALESAELSLTQARIASNIGQPRLKDADFLRGQCDFIAKNVRAAIANATNTH